MSEQTAAKINPGTVLEFFEAKQLLCGVCLAVKNQRLSVLTEQDREINLARSRVTHASSQLLDIGRSRDELVQKLRHIAEVRKALMNHVDAEELWSLLEGEEESYSAEELAEFVFPDSISDDHTAAVQRVLFQDRLYFQFKNGRFVARSREKVEQRRLEIEREREREAQLVAGSEWLRTIWQKKPAPTSLEDREFLIEKLKSFCLYANDSPDYAFVKELLQRANIPVYPSSAFRLLVRLGIWREDENLYLHQQNIAIEFPPEVEALAQQRASEASARDWSGQDRKDLRDIHAVTIDGSLTRDYDDAISIRDLGDGLFEVGVHIADAAEYVTPGDPLDLEAQERASSIYLPDARISMLPSALSEELCSLRAGEDRLALSFIFKIDQDANILATEVYPSIVRIREQLTYTEVNDKVEQVHHLRTLYELSLKLREHRLSLGAIILPLPEIQVHVNSAGMIHISQYKKETPSQIIVSEWMIAANGLAASYLAERGIPAIYRTQAECRQETELVQSEHELFHIYRQRRLFARAELDTKPGMHCSLAMPYYTSITSPIRRYLDLVVQRQLKHAIKTDTPLYSEEELRQLITKLSSVQSRIFFVQRKSVRYWILKYLEQEDIHTLDAIVLDQNDRFIHLLIPDFLLETNMPLTDKVRVQPGEMIRVKVERLNPREEIFRVQM